VLPKRRFEKIKATEKGETIKNRVTTHTVGGGFCGCGWCWGGWGVGHWVGANSIGSLRLMAREREEGGEGWWDVNGKKTLSNCG